MLLGMQHMPTFNVHCLQMSTPPDISTHHLGHIPLAFNVKLLCQEENGSAKSNPMSTKNNVQSVVVFMINKHLGTVAAFMNVSRT